jgi:hypothetical protein
MPACGNGIRVPTAFALAALFIGCAAKKPVEPVDPRRGDVAVRTIDATTAETYPAPEKGEDYDTPYPFEENGAPLYPAKLLSEHLPPVSVKVRLIVDEGGSVTQVAPLDVAAAGDPSFFDSVEAAVRSWQFSPLVKFGQGSGSAGVLLGQWELPADLDYGEKAFLNVTDFVRKVKTKIVGFHLESPTTH